MKRSHDRVLITGGAGFIGTNLAKRLLEQGNFVRILDSLVRPGSDRNIEWLQSEHGAQIELIRADVRDTQAVSAALRHVNHVVHLAAQVAVTSSVRDPREDCAINIGGTLNVLEAARACTHPPSLLFTSTNKVYGALEDLMLTAQGKRYVPLNEGVRRRGISEQRCLSFHSPYGCSKGAADQYVLDYAHSFGLRTAVLRMSCVYGPHQNGTEDQGWVAHFVRSVLEGRPLTIFGDGLQVRDVLFVEDLVEAFQLARQHIDVLSGRAFNIGGGPLHALSLSELISHLEDEIGSLPRIDFADWRVGDQRYYVSDVGRFNAVTDWLPRTAIAVGLQALQEWLQTSTLSVLAGHRATTLPVNAGHHP